VTASGAASAGAPSPPPPSLNASHAGTWVDWCSECTHGSGRVRAPHWSCCGALEEDANCTPGQAVASLPQELLSEFEAVLIAAESARLISSVNAGRLRENIRVGYFNAQQATVAMNAYKRQLAELDGAEAPAATAGNSGSWISNAFQTGAAPVGPNTSGAASEASAALPTSAVTRRFVSSIRNLRDLAQDAPAEEESSDQNKATDEILPYGGNISEAMKANDRDAIKKIMAHRNATPKAADVPEPSEAPKPPPAPRPMPGFVRQMTVRGNNLTFNPVLAEASEDDASSSEAAGELEEGEVAADEVEEKLTLPKKDMRSNFGNFTVVWFSTPPFAGALASAVVSGLLEVANMEILVRRGSGAWIPLKSYGSRNSTVDLELNLPAEVLAATTDKVPQRLEVGIVRSASDSSNPGKFVTVLSTLLTVTVRAVKPAPTRIRIKLPATAQPGQLLKVAVPGSSGGHLQVKVPPNAVPGSTLEFNAAPSSGAEALPPAGFPLRVVNVNAPALSGSSAQWTKLKVVIPPGPTRPAGVTATATMLIPPNTAPGSAMKLKVAEVLSPPSTAQSGGAGASAGGGDNEGDGSLVWKRARLEARLAPLRIKWQDGRMDIRVARKTFLQSALDALPRKDEDWRKTWRFKFEGEPGVDAGGVAREFWSMISAELFSPHAGLFKYSATDQLTYQINPLVNMFRFRH